MYRYLPVSGFARSGCRDPLVCYKIKTMEEVIRNVADIDTADRRALEHLVGRHLSENQQVIISIVSPSLASHETPSAQTDLQIPEWWKIYEGLSDEEVERLDQAIRQRANLTRVFE